MTVDKLTRRVTEIFYSLQGETRTVGLPTAFIRLTGCPLRCGYCDTAYAFTGGQLMTLTQILEKVASFSPRYVTLTGGEPLAQPNALPLLTELCDRNYELSLETSGALDITAVDARVIKVVYIKTPDSGEVQRNRYDNLAYLLAHDQIKFVLSSRADYNWAKATMTQYDLAEKVQVLLSPVHDVLPVRELADWIVADNLPVPLQIQLHKYVWNNEPGR